MPKDRVNRTLTLRSAMSNTDFGHGSGGPGTLERLVKQLHGHLTTIAQRRAKFQDFVIECRHTEESARGLFLHIAAYTPDDLIAVVPSAGRSRAADLQLVEPPPNTEFHDGDLMAFIKGDDVVLCRSGLSEAALSAYVYDLANARNIPPAISSFALFKRADVDKLAMVRRDGIKSVRLSGVAHSASVTRAERESVKQAIFGNLMEELKALAGITDAVPEDAENLKVEVLFSFDKRNGTALDQQELEKLAEHMLESDEEGFTIKTLSGRTIRSDDVVISKVVSLKAFGKTVDYSEAWEALITFYREISVRPGGGQ